MNVNKKALLGISTEVSLERLTAGEGDGRLSGYLFSPLWPGAPLLVLSSVQGPVALPRLVEANQADGGIVAKLADESSWRIAVGEAFSVDFERTMDHISAHRSSLRRWTEQALGLGLPNPELVSDLERWAGVISRRVTTSGSGPNGLLDQLARTPKPNLDFRPCPFQAFGYECSDGWLPLIADLERSLRDLSPHFVIRQVKEKFGTLSFYFNITQGDDKNLADRFRELVSSAELASATVCEICGMPGITDVDHHWYRTECDSCRRRRQDRQRRLSD